MIVIVSHADVIKLVLAYYLGMHVDLFQRIGLSPASVSILALSSSGPVSVLRMNDSGPIKPPNKQKKTESQPDEHQNQHADFSEESDSG